MAERWQAARGVVGARIVSLMLGVWLVVSAFAWPHARVQMTNTWVVGAMSAIFALVAMALPWLHYANTLLAIWLFVSTWALPGFHAQTLWNNVLVSVAMFVVSLVPWDRQAAAPPTLDRATGVVRGGATQWRRHRTGGTGRG